MIIIIGVSYPFPVKYDMSFRQRDDLNETNVMTDICHDGFFFLNLIIYVANGCFQSRS